MHLGVYVIEIALIHMKYEDEMQQNCGIVVGLYVHIFT